jgi:DEAD/DEAH box helicase domain-containing protein
MLHPDNLFDRPSGDLLIDLDSKVILEAHLQCAAQEMPLCRDDDKYFGPLMVEVCEEKLIKDEDAWFVPASLASTKYDVSVLKHDQVSP